jgi:hypothetical protein
MDRPWSSAATRRIAAVLLKEDAMNIDEEREALRQKMEGLQYLGYVLERVQAHSKYLSTMPSAELSDIQKLWVLAYENIDLKMAAGTEESLYEAAASLQTLDNTISQSIKRLPDEQPRFSLFGRRRGR